MIVLLGFYLINYQLTLLPVIYISLVYAPFCYVIWHLGIPFGLHAILQTMVIVVITYFLTRIPIIKCVIAISTSVIIKISLEVILQPILTSLTGIDYRQVIQVPAYTVAFPLPGLIIMATLYCILKRRNLYLFNLNN